MDDFVVNVRQIGNYPLTSAIGPNDILLMQQNGLGGAYASIKPAAILNAALASGGGINFATGYGLAWNNDAINLKSDGISIISNAPLIATGLTVTGPALLNGSPFASQAFVHEQITNNKVATVNTFNRRSGDVLLTIQDIITAGGAQNDNPYFTGNARAPTVWNSRQSDDAIATTAFVWSVINDLVCNERLVFSFNGRGGNVQLTTQDLNDAYFETGGTIPRVPNPAPGDASNRIPTTQWTVDEIGLAVDEAIAAIGNPSQDVMDWVAANFVTIQNGQMQGVPTAPTAPPGSTTSQIATTAFVMNAVTGATAGVASFNTRTGAVTLTTADVTSAGGAPINSPVFTGNPTAPTPTTADSDTSVATTAFVHAVVTALPANVLSFNGRTGAVSLTTADITGAGGAPSNNPTFTGTPAAPTASPGTSTTQLATTAFVTAALAVVGSGVISWNGRTGAVTLQANDVSAVGGAMLASPTFTGIPAAPTAAPGTNTTQLATTAFVTAALGGATGIVSSFNGRSGAVTLTTADVTGAGGAPLNNPNLTGTPTAPTPLQTVNDTTIATTAFVKAALATATGVASFNSRTGAVTLTGADVTGAGGALLASPSFTGTPTAPTAAPGVSTQQLATTAFVTSAIGSAVTSFNSRTGAITLISGDITGAGGALVNSPTFTGTPTAPTPTAGTNNTQLATTAFVMSATSASLVQIKDTPPVNPIPGQLWWESDTGVSYIRYDDGDSQQWVTAMPVSDASTFAVRFDQAQQLTSTQQVQARQNIYAAPLDAMASSGIQINGAMDISQEFGTAAVAGITTSKYVIDGWLLQSAGTQVMTSGLNTTVPPIFRYALQAVPTTANPSPAAGSYVLLSQRVEGNRILRLGWGTAQAQPMTIAFWVYALRPGTYSGAVNNGASNRSYVFPFTINVASTWEYKTVIIPGDTTGTWPTDTSKAMTLSFTLMASSDLQTAPNVWTAGSFLGATGTINGVAALTDTFLLTGVVMLPGIEAPSISRDAYIMRPYDQELLTCQRYFYRRDYPVVSAWIATLQAYTTALASGPLMEFAVRMRAPPAGSAGPSLASFGLLNAAGSPSAVTGGAITSTVDFAQLNGVTSGSTLVAGNAALFSVLVANCWHQFDARL